MFPGSVNLNDMNMNIMNNMNNFMNTMNINNMNNMNMNDINMNTMNLNNMNNMNMNDINMNNMNTGIYNMNNMDETMYNMNNMDTTTYNMNNMNTNYNNRYNINRNINNMNNMGWNNTNTSINNMNMNMNNMNSCMLNMNNINFELCKAFFYTMMMNQNTMNPLNTMINPYLFLMNQQNNSPNTRFISSRNQNEQTIIQNGGVLPRTFRENNNNKNNIPFPEYTGHRINIIFETGTGLKYIFPSPLNVPLKEVLLMFMRKVGVSESLLGYKIFFILNGLTISKNEESSVKAYFEKHNFGMPNQVKIVVIDASNVIGA